MRLWSLLPTTEQLPRKLLLPDERLELGSVLTNWLQWRRCFDLPGGLDSAVLRGSVHEGSEGALVYVVIEHGRSGRERYGYELGGCRRRAMTLRGDYVAASS